MRTLADLLRNVPFEEMLHDIDRAALYIDDEEEDVLDGLTAVAMFLDRLHDMLQAELAET
jgi:hypothetical protein